MLLYPENEDIWCVGAGSDFEKVEYFAKWIWATEEEQKKGLVDLQIRSRKLVDEHWKSIEALANELLSARELERFEAEIVVDIATGEAAPGDLDIYRARKAQFKRKE